MEKKGLFNTSLIAVVIILAVSCRATEKKDCSEWRDLFNGTNLDGWTVKMAGDNISEGSSETTRCGSRKNEKTQIKTITRAISGSQSRKAPTGQLHAG